ncbi:MAG: endonuclease Q family protein [Patescibacteria group bacterium]
MRVIADLHIHSRYSRACSKSLSLRHLQEWGQFKGITVLGTGDFTHPKWLEEIERDLVPGPEGLYSFRNASPAFPAAAPMHFMLTVELSCIYRKTEKTRRIHVLIFAPDIPTVKKINARLGAIGKLASDGRPILGIDVKEIVKIALDANPACFIVPAHAWTPWFAVFGSKSGFDSLEECFEELTPNIFAIETGLSSDPLMNRRLSALDKVACISNSDAHSAQNLGREANVFELERVSYNAIMDAIKANDPRWFPETIEFYPEEGKYHVDGHRECEVRFLPPETLRHKGICPKCFRPLTIGVLHRVHTLADRSEGDVSKQRPGHRYAVPLMQVLAEGFGVGVKSKRVQEEYFRLIKILGSEFDLLLNVPIDEIVRIAPIAGEGIRRIRAGELQIEPGYDGVYGTVRIFKSDEISRFQLKQQGLW